MKNKIQKFGWTLMFTSLTAIVVLFATSLAKLPSLSMIEIAHYTVEVVAVFIILVLLLMVGMLLALATSKHNVE
jgi:cytochrome c biogenesis factor